VVSPRLIRRGGTPLAKPADLARHVLLHLDDPDGRTPWLEWSVWLAANGQPGLKPAGSLRFKLYDQLIQAAVGGQGVALGRLPLIADHLRDGRLATPFPKRYDSERGYYAVVAPHAADRGDVAAFVAWLADEARAELGKAALDAAPAKTARRPSSRRAATGRSGR
jgi:LysR family glycine cleavage system transcriptional activator